MGMSSWVLDNEEMFYGTANDIMLEYQYPEINAEGANNFITSMMKHRDLLAHQSDSAITSVLLEMYYS